MKPRDAIIFAAVILIAGFAAADAIRGRAAGNDALAPTTVPRQTTPSRLRGPQPRPEAPAEWPIGTLRGALVFTDATNCSVRVIGLAGGVERPLGRFAGDCELWAPRVTQNIAYALGPSSADNFTPFRVADLARPNSELGGYRALFGVVIWSPDGQRVAWCGRRRTGFDLEVGGPAERLPRCPSAYTPEGRIAYTVGNRLIVGERTLLRVEGGITFAAFPDRSSVVVIVDGKRIETYKGKSRAFSLDLPPRLEGRTPIVSPDGCAALFHLRQPPVGGVELRSLGCFRGKSPQFFQGRDGTWSPDGEWVAIAEPDSIAFHKVSGARRTIHWPAQAAQLAWRPR